MYQRLCHCNEKAFCIHKTCYNDKLDKFEKRLIFYCGRPSKKSEFYNMKKKPCEFYIDEIEVSNFTAANRLPLVEKPHGRAVRTGRTGKKKLISNKNTINYYKLLINHLKFYFVNTSNYISYLNFYLNKCEFDYHYPEKESYEELIFRIQNKIYKKNKNIIYVNSEAQKCKIVGEENNNFNREREFLKLCKYKDYLQSAYKIKPTPLKLKLLNMIENISIEDYNTDYTKKINFNWTKHTDINYFLTRPVLKRNFGKKLKKKKRKYRKQQIIADSDSESQHSEDEKSDSDSDSSDKGEKDGFDLEQDEMSEVEDDSDSSGDFSD